MEKTQRPAPTHEIIFGSASDRELTAISRDLVSGRLRRLAPRLYTTNLTDTPEGVTRRHLYRILSHYYPKAVVSLRSALEGDMLKDDTIFLTCRANSKPVSLPGITLCLFQGQGAVGGDTPLAEGLFLASPPRALLESLQQAHARSICAKGWSRAEIEGYLDELARTHGDDELNRLREQAWRIAPALKLEAEFNALDTLIGDILAPRATSLVAQAVRIRDSEAPYDEQRVKLFRTLSTALRRTVPHIRPMPVLNPEGQRNFAFFEAYFANCIDEIGLEVEEAADIVLRDRRVPAPSAAAHGLLGTYRIVSHREEMRRVPASADEFLAILKSRHGRLLAGRPEQPTDRFTQRENRTGEAASVVPEVVMGTLIKGIELFQALEDPFARAIYMMFLVAEAHPYRDSNECLARIMMNAELAHSGLCRIIIPTVYRKEYLLAHWTLAHQDDAGPYISMLDRAQEYTALIDYNDYDMAAAQFRESGAFLPSREAEWLRPCEVFWD
jgi:hypothetical protein